MQGTFVRRAEVLFSANYFGFDDVVTSDGERISDRICAIPFQDLPDMSPTEYVSRQKKFKAVIDSEEKPMEFIIGEMGDFILSDEFMSKRTEFSELLMNMCEELIYPRTLLTNYASFYTITWKLHTIFEGVLSEEGYTWEGMLKWMKTVHAPFLIKQHQQKEHAGLSIRRYFNALLNFTLEWSLLERRKLMKLMETAKLKSGEKYCLAYHPSRSIQDLQDLGGVSLKDLKDHANAVGGCWGSDSWALLVRDDADIDIDTSADDEKQTGLENTQSKRAILIPVSVFTSTQKRRICDHLEQNDDYKRFGVDEETPSGVEEFSNYRNSTQIPGSQGLRLHVSSIQEVEEEENVIFDELSRPDDFHEGEDEDEEEEDSGENEEEGRQETTEPHSCIECDDEFITRSDLKNHMRSMHRVKDKQLKETSTSRYITEVSRNDKTYFVCSCGFSSLQKSAATRHKCRSGESLSFHCLDCNKPCSNPGSLKRHMNSKHKNGTVVQPSQEIADSSRAHLNDTRKTCDICHKTLLNESNLKKHMERVHAQEVQQASSSTTVTPDNPPSTASASTTAKNASNNSCGICGKTLMNESNLKKHMERVHSSTQEKISSTKALSQSKIRSLLNQTVDESTPNNSMPNLSCTICSKTLKTKANLEKHMSQVHKDAPSPISEKNERGENQERRTRLGSRSQPSRRRSISLQKHKGKRKY